MSRVQSKWHGLTTPHPRKIRLPSTISSMSDFVSSEHTLTQPDKPGLDYVDSVHEAETLSEVMWIDHHGEQDPRNRQTLNRMRQAVIEMRLRTQHAIDPLRWPMVQHEAIEFTPDGTPSPADPDSGSRSLPPDVSLGHVSVCERIAALSQTSTHCFVHFL
jgi:hypothetical protein